MSLMVRPFWENALLSLQRMIDARQMSAGVTARSQERVLRYRQHLEHAEVRSKYRSSSFRGPERLALTGVEKTAPSYQALILTSDGRIAGTKRLASRNDDEALHAAEGIASDHAVDLWDGLRFIEHFKPKPGSMPFKQ